MPHQPSHILVVDDEPDIRDILEDILQDEGYEVSLAENASQARSTFRSQRPDLVLLDIWMPDEDGISVLKRWVEDRELNDIPVIMISGHGTVENAVEAVKLGAYDFLEKPLSTGKLLLCIERGLDNANLRRENRRLKSKLNHGSPLISHSESSKELLRHIRLLGPTDSWVFITGEAGTGKHLVARKVHEHSERKDAAFVELNLAAMPSDSVAQALFGSEQDGEIIKGGFEQAGGGTLFINEVLDLNLDTQNMLLSALQEQQFLRLGGNEFIQIDVRVIVTTSGNPLQAVDAGSFKEDLYYRLNVIPIQVPALRERKQDLPELITLFIEDIAEKNQISVPEVSPSALELLSDHPWPGNARQLQNVLQRLLILNIDKKIDEESVHHALAGDLAPPPIDDDVPDYFGHSMRKAKKAFESAYLKYHLKLVKGNISRLADEVAMERTHLYRKLKNLGISPRDADD